MKWSIPNGGRRRLVLRTERGSIEIPFKERVDLSARRYPYRLLFLDNYGRIYDRMDGFHRLSETKALAEDLVANGLG